jgi:PAS domain S-box-containing protein
MSAKLLRKRAEQKLAAALINDGDESESRMQLHELQVHQVMLEMQNSELEMLNEALATANTARQSLLESKKLLKLESFHLQTLINASFDLMWLKNIAGVYQNCNSGVGSLFGVNTEQIVGKTDYDFFDITLADSFRFHDMVAMQSDRPRVNEEQVVFIDGHPKRLQITKAAMFDQENNTIGVLGIGRIIAERKKAE